MDFPLNQCLLNVKTKFDFLRRQRKEKDIKKLQHVYEYSHRQHHIQMHYPILHVLFILRGPAQCLTLQCFYQSVQQQTGLFKLCQYSNRKQQE